MSEKKKTTAKKAAPVKRKTTKKPVGNPDIAKEGKKYQWKPGQSGNPNGQPRKGISLVNAQLKEAGYEPATKEDVLENYMQLMNLPKDELEKVVKDEGQPILIHLLARNLLWGKGFDVAERMLDRTMGKATQKKEISGKDGKDLFPDMSKKGKTLLDKLLG